MGTTVRPEISPKSKYWINKHRYYELKHFCLQYPLWRKCCIEAETSALVTASVIRAGKTAEYGAEHPSPLEDSAERMMYYADKMVMLEKTAKETSPDL